MDRLSIKRQGSPQHDVISTLIDIAFQRALSLDSAISSEVLELPGMSGPLYRMFINNLVRMISKPRYLEVGSWAGSTACSAMDRNVLKMVCIDNWSEFGGPKDEFFTNISRFKGPFVDFTFVESDYRAVNFHQLGRFNIYLYDGPHEERDQYDGLALYDSVLDDDFAFIVDDWNWERVRKGTFKAIRDSGFLIDFAIEVRSTVDETHGSAGAAADWHNGYFLGKLSRRTRSFDF